MTPEPPADSSQIARCADTLGFLQPPLCAAESPYSTDRAYVLRKDVSKAGAVATDWQISAHRSSLPPKKLRHARRVFRQTWPTVTVKAQRLQHQSQRALMVIMRNRPVPTFRFGAHDHRGHSAASPVARSVT